MDKYCKTLELHKILEMLAAKASNGRTREMIAATEPQTDIDIVRREIKKTAEAFDFSVKNGCPPFYNFKDIRPMLAKAESGGSLTLRELLDVAVMLRQIRELKEWFASAAAEISEDADAYSKLLLAPFFDSLTGDNHLERRIKGSILSEDEIADTASPELGDIRRKIARCGVKIRESLDKMVKSSDVKKALQESIVTIRDGRYVLPVRAEFKGAVPGIVHASSASGSTLFIEPIAVVEANNDIRILKDMEQEEIERIIAELSADCGSISEKLSLDFETCAEIDLYFSRSELAADMNASEPIISDDGVIDLIRARHPLIPAASVVPVDLKLGGDYDTLIVTGPNTGGKTVLLKTAGLLTAMMMCGLMIPASDGSRVSVFRKILVDIGDMQSIENDLSTFSSHMGNVIGICAAADTESLVLMDELGSGTDPVEGAALAEAIIGDIRSKGAKIMVTTHYQELKLYAVTAEGVENGSCEFDMENMRPTYRLMIGSPGRSNAFSISERLGLPKHIIEKAKASVSGENRRFEEVVGGLEASKREYDLLKAEAEHLKNEQARLTEELAAEKKRFEDSRDQEFEKARIEAMRIVEGCRAESDKLLDELNELRRQKDKANFGQAVTGAKSMSRSALDRMYRTANPVMKNDNSDYKLPRPLKRGDTVLIVGTGRKGIVAGEPDSSGNIFVQAGVMRTKTNIRELRLVEPEKSAQAPKSKVTAKGVRSASERKASVEIDIRGMTVDEGILEVDAFIDNAVMTHTGLVTVIHGKGTGMLRDGIQRHLRSHPSVKSFRDGLFGEGENGVTVVTLK